MATDDRECLVCGDEIDLAGEYDVVSFIPPNGDGQPLTPPHDDHDVEERFIHESCKEDTTPVEVVEDGE